MRHLPIKSKLFRNNRVRLAELLEPKALTVVNANDPMPTNADGTMMIHPNSDLFYLTGKKSHLKIVFAGFLFTQAIFFRSVKRFRKMRPRALEHT